jgi:thiamine biosynthesis lipoprotein
VLGPQADGIPWRIGIRHPRRTDSVLATIALSKGALATSGDYERYFEFDGQRYCHILDPRNGRPVNTFQSVSVVAPLCVIAGSCASIAMLEGERENSQLVRAGAPHLIVRRDGTIFGTLATASVSSDS